MARAYYATQTNRTLNIGEPYLGESIEEDSLFIILDGLIQKIQNPHLIQTFQHQ